MRSPRYSTPSRARARWRGAALAAVALAAPALRAQEGRPIFRRLSIEHGLSQSIVDAIAQDRTGFMWFATEDGLDRYDGYRFVVYRSRPGDPTSLSHSELKALLVDRSGALWVGTFEGGLDRLDPERDLVTVYRHDPADPSSLAGNTVRALLEARDGAIWVGTQGAGLDRLDPATGRFTHFRHDPADPSSLGHDDVRALLEDGQGGIWVGTHGGGLDRLDPASGRCAHFRHDPARPASLADDLVLALLESSTGELWVGTYGGGLDRLDRATGGFAHHRHDRRDPGSLPSNHVRALAEDHLGALWVGTDGGGLARRDPQTGAWATLRHDPLDPASLPTDRVYSLFEDRSHVLWVGTYGGGLAATEVGRKRFRSYRSVRQDPTSLGHDIVWALHEDSSGVLWVGTDSGGLDRFDAASGVFQHFRHDPADPGSLSHDTVRAITHGPGGELWVATHGGGLDRLDPSSGRFRVFRHDPADPDSLGHDELRCLHVDGEGALWVGTFGAGLDRLDPASGRFTHFRHDEADPSSLSHDFVRTVVDDGSGSLWVGTQGGGLDLLDPRTGRCRHLRHDPADPTSLSNDFVFAVHRGRSGAVWVGTYGGGLNRLDPSTGRSTVFTTEQGLPSDSLYAIREDDRGDLWISTNLGLSRFDPATETFTNYDTRDGLPSNEFNGGAALERASGELLFGSISGFVVFRPQEIRGNTVPPAVVVTDLQLANRSVRPGRGDGRPPVLTRPVSFTPRVQLSHRDDVVSFEFAALHFAAPEKNRYAYRLEGFSDAWSAVDASRRLATFTDLAPGRYTFRVKAANADGVWNQEGASLGVVVTPPWWATWSFRLGVAALAAAAVGFAARRRLRAVRMRAELAAAHDAQMAIMPRSAPPLDRFDIAGVCIPANEVGGDFFDYLWLDRAGGRLAVAVCDVSGKAMPAAMAAVMTNGLLVSWADQGLEADRLMTGLNRSVHRKIGRRMFAALCLVVLDPATGQVELVNAGLCEPLLRSGDAVKAVAGAGSRVPLGVFGDTTYQSRRRRFVSGDVLVVHTDGVLEASDRAGRLYGGERLESLLAGLDPATLSAAAIRDAVVRDVARFAGGSHHGDDMTVVVVKAR